jgi:hypothetical protein
VVVTVVVAVVGIVHSWYDWHNNGQLLRTKTPSITEVHSLVVNLAQFDESLQIGFVVELAVEVEDEVVAVVTVVVVVAVTVVVVVALVLVTVVTVVLVVAAVVVDDVHVLHRIGHRWRSCAAMAASIGGTVLTQSASSKPPWRQSSGSGTPLQYTDVLVDVLALVEVDDVCVVVVVVVVIVVVVLVVGMHVPHRTLQFSRK